MSEYRDTFESGDRVRVAGGYGYVTPYAYDGAIGRVIGTESTTGRVQVRFPVPVNVDGAHRHGRYVSPTDGTFHADWLHRVVFVSVRFYGPGMQPGRSEFHGARYVVTGTRGNRQQMTVPHDDAVHGWDAHSNGANAAHAFAISRLAFCDPDVELIRDRRGRNSGRIYAITERGTCDCSPDSYGPCEFHGETLVSREGASVRTADDLSHTFCEDVCSVTHSYPSPEFEADLVRLGNALADGESFGVRWLPDAGEDGEDMRDTLSDMVTNAEAHLGAHGLSVWWEDGYRIVRVTGGPCA